MQKFFNSTSLFFPFRQFSKSISPFSRIRFSKGCIAGISYCIISPKGDVQPCAYFDLRVGNVKEEAFDKIWKDSPVFEKMRTEEYSGGCGICDHKSICGGCRARAYYNYEGDYMAEDTWCILNKA